ncbi:MAG: transcriptional regulator with XRE-family HTH domain [Halieaceae bacterium]
MGFLFIEITIFHYIPVYQSNSKYMYTVSQWLKKIRTDNNLSLFQFAEIWNQNVGSVTSYERGASPSFIDIIKLAAELDFSLDEFVNDYKKGNKLENIPIKKAHIVSRPKKIQPYINIKKRMSGLKKLDMQKQKK